MHAIVGLLCVSLSIIAWAVVGNIIPVATGSIPSAQCTVVSTGDETHNERSDRGLRAKPVTRRYARAECTEDSSGARVNTSLPSEHLQAGDRATVWNDRTIFGRGPTFRDPARSTPIAIGFVVGFAAVAGFMIRLIVRRRAERPPGPRPPRARRRRHTTARPYNPYLHRD